jgi:Spy/CpxP family protein refolding chaperone
MNRTLLTALLLGAALSLSPTLRAEETKPAAGDRLRERLKEAGEKLGLTEEQKEKLKPIFQAEAEKVKELRADTSLTPEQKREKFKAIRDEVAPKIKEILTPEQFAKWQKMREEFREKIGQRRREK